MQKRKTPQKFVLIDGTFTPEEAKEVIINLLEFKIQYHSRENFSNEIRFGKKSENSLERKAQLQQEKKNFSNFIAGIPDGQLLRINSLIHIE